MGGFCVIILLLLGAWRIFSLLYGVLAGFLLSVGFWGCSFQTFVERFHVSNCEVIFPLICEMELVICGRICLVV